ncbi:MAG: hypothetical protein WCT10_00565 [Patescibacteria group bacterium]|jgi:hypothetical protein
MKRLTDHLAAKAAVIIGTMVCSVFVVMAPASAFVCPATDPTGAISCTGSNRWCGNTCQLEPTCPIAPDTQKTKLICGTCACGCPDDKPNSCSGAYICQKSNATCDPLNKVSVCSAADDTMVCGGCKASFTMCPGDLCKATTSASCPSPAVYDPCTEKCVEKYVLTKASYALPTTVVPQDVDIKIAGNMSLTAGDLTLSDGKAIRADGAGETILNIGNWGAGATGVRAVVYGSLMANGISTLSGDLTTEPETLETDRLCLGKTAPVCRDYWPLGLPESAAANATLRYDGSNWTASTLLSNDTANVGIGTVAPEKTLDIFGQTGGVILRLNQDTGSALWTGLSLARQKAEKWFLGLETFDDRFIIRRNATTNDLVISSAAGTAGYVGLGTDTPDQKLDVRGTVAMQGFQMSGGAADKYVLTSDANGFGTWQNLVGLPETAAAGDTLRYDGAAWIKNSFLYNDGSRIGISETTPGFRLDISGSEAVLPITRLSGPPLAKVWTGLRLDRARDAEQWYMGMDDATEDLLFRNVNLGVTDDLKNAVRISAADGTLSANKFKLAKPTTDGFVMQSDASGNADWAYMLAADECTGGKIYKLTAAAYNGSQGGYKGLDTICRGAEPDEKQHVCTPDEVLRSSYCLSAAEWSLFVGQSAWVASGPPGFTAPAVNDCNGWTTSTGYGAFWSFDANGGIGYATSCAVALPVACCKP